jgi:aminoglycoside phosphotransferase (APT) family kinase protein
VSDAPTSIETPWRRDADELAERLQAWARHRFGAAATLGAVTTPEGNGMSSETVLFELTQPDGATRGCVARLAPDPSVFPVFEEYDLDLQARCMQLVGAVTEVPVPNVISHESDTAWLGTPFLVMERIAGTPPTDVPPYVFGGWVADFSAAERAEMMARSVDVLVRLHAITPSTHDLSFLAHHDDGTSVIDQLLAAQRHYYDWARGDLRSSLIEATFDWLGANRPATNERVLNWGDSRIGNVLYRGVEPVAVLDWEMAALGPREVDIAWMIFMHRFFQNLAETYGFEGLPDFMTRDRVVELYTAGSGIEVRDLAWFEVYAALRFAIVSVRTSLRGIHYGQQEAVGDPDELIMFRPLLEQMLAGTFWG